MSGNSHLSVLLLSYSMSAVVVASTRDRRRSFEREDVVFDAVVVGPNRIEGTEKTSMVSGSHPLQVPIT